MKTKSESVSKSKGNGSWQQLRTSDEPNQPSDNSDCSREQMIAETAYFHAEQRGFMPGANLAIGCRPRLNWMKRRDTEDVGADAQLTQGAGIRCPTCTLRKHFLSMRGQTLAMGQSKPAAWVNSWSAPTSRTSTLLRWRTLHRIMQSIINHSHELVDIEWLGHVAKESGFETPLDVILVGIGRQRYDRDVDGSRIFLQELKGVMTVHARHPYVQQNYVGQMRTRHIETLRTVEGCQQLYITSQRKQCPD